MPTPTDPESLSVAAVHQLLADLARSGSSPRTITSEATGGGWSISLVICPSANAAAEAQTRCQRDTLSVLSSTVRLTTAGVLAALERRGMLHGERTVRGALADLVRAGLVLNSRSAPRGYYLPSADTGQATA
jgi:hypothetical protein